MGQIEPTIGCDHPGDNVNEGVLRFPQNSSNDCISQRIHTFPNDITPYFYIYY